MKNFVILVFLGIQFKIKTKIVFDISPRHLEKFLVSSFGPKCCHPIKLQESSKCNIVIKRWMTKFIFCMHINIKVFCKAILSFWVSVTRHAQSAQNKFAYLCNMSIKAWGMKLIFCLQITLGVHGQTGQKYYKQPVRKIFAISKGKHEGWSCFCLLINVECFFKLILSF